MKTLLAGSLAPDFELPDQKGKTHQLSALLLRGPVTLFFYPGVGFGGGSREAVYFRDLVKSFAGVGAHRIGVNTDDTVTQEVFAQSELLDYPLLSDVDGRVATAYGVRRRFLSRVKRTTFVIDQNQRVVEVISSETNMHVHADRALQVLEGLTRQT